MAAFLTSLRTRTELALFQPCRFFQAVQSLTEINPQMPPGGFHRRTSPFIEDWWSKESLPQEVPFKTLLYCLPRKYTIPIWHQHQHRINIYRTLPLLSLQTILLSAVSNGQVPCSIVSKTKGILKKAAHVSSLVTYSLCSHWLHFGTLYFLASTGSFAPLVIKHCTTIALIPSLPRLAFNVLSLASH